jgi:maltose alpha-D-glucosyltransferase/alpha-amylase
VLLTVELDDASRETYAMPLRFSTTSQSETASELRASLVADIELRAADGQPARGALLDASSSRPFAEGLLTMFRQGQSVPSESGSLRALLFGRAEAPEASLLEPRFLAFDQSNSTIIYGSKWLLKLLRKVEPGANMELEVGRFLADAQPPAKVPKPVGSLELTSDAGARTLGVLSEYVENRGSAWSVTLENLFTFFERIVTSDVAQAVPLPSSHPAACTDPIPDELVRLASPYFTLVRLLAERTAEMHRALGSPSSVPGFGQEPFSMLHQNSLYQSAHAELARGFAKLRDGLPTLSDDARELAKRVLAQQSAIDDKLRLVTRNKAEVTRIRCHGDYHLGQVLFTGDDFTIIDFEGEPGRPLSERRYKRSPLRDVAGMMRSFAYAAESALRSERVRSEDRARLVPWAEAFRAWVCVSYVRTYLVGIAGESYCPKTPESAGVLLEFYELEKVLYEVNYELNNRPTWVRVPLAGLARIAGAK